LIDFRRVVVGGSVNYPEWDQQVEVEPGEEKSRNKTAKRSSTFRLIRLLAVAWRLADPVWRFDEVFIALSFRQLGARR
jgi:hypothetical protein